MLSGALSGLKKVRGAIGRGLQQIIRSSYWSGARS
jgi:hypothetical protein